MIQYIGDLAALIVTIISGGVAGFWIARSKVVKSLAQSNEDLAEQLSLVSRTLDDVQAKYIALQDEHAKVRQSITEIRVHNRFLAERVDALEAENRRLHGELAILRRENKRLIKQNEAMLAGVRKLVTQIQNLGHTPAWEPPESNGDAL